MQKKIKKQIEILSLKYLEMQDFAEAAMLNEIRLLPWMGGFYIFYSAEAQYCPENDTLLVQIPFVYYTPGEYKKYLTMNRSSRQLQPNDNCSGVTAPDQYYIKIIRREPYEKDEISKSILSAITKREKSRKKFESEQRQRQS
jgi:hypothetical protein